MTEMEMPLPDNTLPMMTGDGPYGSVEMGGMFSVLKVRENQKPGDYSDPGWYKQPKGTQAYEYMAEELPPVKTSSKSGPSAMKPKNMPASGIEVQVKKPSGHSGH